MFTPDENSPEYKALKFLIDTTSREDLIRLNTYLRRYIAPQVAQELFENQELSKLLQPHLVDRIVALILDIRGFVRTTKAGEQQKKLGLRSVANWLQQIFPTIIKIAFDNRGLIGEFSGDRVMIIYGYPQVQNSENHWDKNIRRALRTALAIQNLVKNIKNDQAIDPVLRNFDLGIGVCAGGPAWIGNLDNEWRQELLVISTAANIAARAEELTKNKKLMADVSGLNIIVNQIIVNEFHEAIEHGQLQVGDLGPQKVRGLDGIYNFFHIKQVDPELLASNGNYSEKHTDFVHWLSEYLDGALERDNSIRLQQALGKIGKIIASEQSSIVFERLMTEIKRLFAAQTATLYRVDWDTEQLIFEQSIGPSAPETGLRIPLTGIAGSTAKDGKSRLIKDLHLEPGWYKNIGNQQDQHAMMCVPLAAQNKIIGVIQVIDKLPGRFTEQDITTLEAFAGSAAMAIINADNAAHYRHQLRDLSILKIQNEITLTLATVDLDEVLNKVMNDAIRTYISPRSATLYLVKGNELEFTKMLSQSSDVMQLVGTRMPADAGIAGMVAQTKKPYLSNDVHQDPNWLRGKSERWLQTVGQETRSMLCVPMVAKDQVVGVIQVIDNRPDVFNEDHLTIISWLATSAAIAVDNAAKYQELELAHKELQETRDRYIAAQTMAGLGHVVGELAHDLTNDIAAIRTNAKWLIQGRRDREVVANKILTLADGTMNLIRRIREPLVMTSGETDLQQALNNLREETESYLHKKAIINTEPEIVLEFDLNSSVIVEGNEEKIVAIFRNLVRNSIRAIERTGRNGRITVREVPTTIDPQKFIRIEVEDTGIGLTKVAQEKIFNFGYTDKPEGQVGGYGLYAVALTVKSLGGHIEVRNEQVEGATFAVELPFITLREEED